MFLIKYLDLKNGNKNPISQKEEESNGHSEDNCFIPAICAVKRVPYALYQIPCEAKVDSVEGVLKQLGSQRISAIQKTEHTVGVFIWFDPSLRLEQSVSENGHVGEVDDFIGSPDVLGKVELEKVAGINDHEDRKDFVGVWLQVLVSEDEYARKETEEAW